MLNARGVRLSLRRNESVPHSRFVLPPARPQRLLCARASPQSDTPSPGSPRLAARPLGHLNRRRACERLRTPSVVPPRRLLRGPPCDATQRQRRTPRSPSSPSHPTSTPHPSVCVVKPTTSRAPSARHANMPCVRDVQPCERYAYNTNSVSGTLQKKRS